MAWDRHIMLGLIRVCNVPQSRKVKKPREGFGLESTMQSSSASCPEDEGWGKVILDWSHKHPPKPHRSPQSIHLLLTRLNRPRKRRISHHRPPKRTLLTSYHPQHKYHRLRKPRMTRPTVQSMLLSLQTTAGNEYCSIMRTPLTDSPNHLLWTHFAPLLTYETICKTTLRAASIQKSRFVITWKQWTESAVNAVQQDSRPKSLHGAVTQGGPKQ